MEIHHRIMQHSVL